MRPMNPTAHGNYDERTDTVYDASIDRWVPAAAFYAEYKIPTYTDADTKMSRNKQAALVLAAIAALLVAIALTAALSGNDDQEKANEHLSTSSEQMYLDEIESLNIMATGRDAESAMLETGYLACGMLDEGYSVDQIAMIGYDNSNATHGEEGLSYSQARKMVTLAEDYLC